MALEIVVLAAGMGSRMKSSTPKVLHKVAGKPMLDYLVQTIRKLEPAALHLVIGQGGNQVRDHFSSAADIHFVEQSEQLGTGHALMQALPQCDPDNQLLVLLGDGPFISEQTLKNLAVVNADLALLTAEVPDPTGLGRIIRGHDEQLIGIVEERDATVDQKAVTEINTGVMAARCSTFASALSAVRDDNEQKEYLLTDVISILVEQGKSVKSYKTPDQKDFRAVNNMVELADLEREVQRELAISLMRSGVRIMDPARFDLRGNLQAGTDVVIDVGCVFEGDNCLGDNVSIGANCIITNATIGDGCEIKPHSVIDGAIMESGCSVGPFARLRPGTELSAGVAIGNFVEIKKSHLGKGSKASHLSYLGDATIGKDVNIGAGTITCNYDGVNKHQTTIGDNVFVGSNSALVAPVVIKDQSTVAAGSVITKEVPANSLGIARGRQKNIEGWNGPGAVDN